MSRKVPKGWLNYTNMGMQIEGTRFVPLKTPLLPTICRGNLPKARWFTPKDVLKKPHLKLIINLTNANNGRYYNYTEFSNAGIDVVQIKSDGHGVIPPAQCIKKFIAVVEDFIEREGPQSAALIGVHCTHGLNRTGYFICKYLMDKMNMSPDAAIHLFESARGHKIERIQYVRDLKQSCEWTANIESTEPVDNTITHTDDEEDLTYPN